MCLSVRGCGFCGRGKADEHMRGRRVANRTQGKSIRSSYFGVPANLVEGRLPSRGVALYICAACARWSEINLLLKGFSAEVWVLRLGAAGRSSVERAGAA